MTVTAGRALVGISGWRYAGWRGDFYPRGLPQRLELEYASERLGSIELNGSFYSLQRPTSWAAWASTVPDDFVFSVKAPRYVTHILRLRDTRTALANFFASGVLTLGRRLGPVLWQLPATLPFDADALRGFLELLPSTAEEAARLASEHDSRLDGRAAFSVTEDRPLRHAMEPRHPGFGDPEAIRLLRDAGVALVVADTAGRFPAFDEVTADHVYVRLHGADELYTSGYTEEALVRWAARVRGWLDGSGSPDGRPRDVHAYFDNDVKVRAPHDAMRLAAILRDRDTPV